MNIKKQFAKVFHGKQADKKEHHEKRITEEHEQKVIQQKMAMLNGEVAKH
jgi:hypothetical protein